MTASVRISTGTAGCSGTFIRHEGKIKLLTAKHCVRSVGQRVTIYWQKKLAGKVERISRNHDLALVAIDGSEELDLPIAKIAGRVSSGMQAWHHGFGVDRPGNVERGEIINPGDFRRDCTFTVRLSSGDSGCGVFSESGELIAVGAWGSGRQFGGPSLAQIQSFLTASSEPG